MDRRAFIGSAGGLAAAGAVTSPAIAQERYRWRMVSRWRAPFPDQPEAAQRLAERITAMSGGRLTVEVLGPGDLGSYGETFDRVASGEVEMARSLSYDWRSRGFAFDVFCFAPFGMTEGERTIWRQTFEGQQLWDALYADFGVKPFAAGSVGPQAFGWFAEPLTSMDQLQGLHYRTTGINVAVMEALGARPVNMPGGEIGAAIAAGELDAYELVGPAVDLAFDLHRFLPHYIFPSFHQTAGTVELIVNRERFLALPQELQQIVENAAQAEHQANLADVHASNIRALEILRRDHGVQTSSLPEEILTRIGAVASEILAEARDTAAPEHQRVFDSFAEARRRIRTWTELTEGPFMAARALPFSYPPAR